MFGLKVKNAFLGTAAVSAMVVGLGISPAMADVPPFTINPNAVPAGSDGNFNIVTVSPLVTAPYANQVATDISGVSNGLIQQTGPTTQFEQGYVQFDTIRNGATSLTTYGPLGTGLTTSGNGFGGTYGMYATFTATAQNIGPVIGPGTSGTIGAGDFTFKLFIDPSTNDVFSAGSTNNLGGVAPSVTDTSGDDVVVGIATSLFGDVGFSSNGAAHFSATSQFILCNGTVNQGLLGGVVVTGGIATGCGTFDARNYFIAPVPFFNINLASTISGSGNNIGSPNAGGPGFPNALLTGIVADLNFTNVPEPATLGLFGLGLVAIGGLVRRKRATS